MWCLSSPLFFFLIFFMYIFNMTSVITEYEPIIEILEDILGECKLHNEYKGQISFDCPVCSYELKGMDHGDGKGNLEINYIREVYKCWACGETNETHGSIFKLIKKYGTTKHLKNFILLRPESSDNEIVRIYEQVKLPPEYILFNSASNGLKLTHFYKQAKNYLNGRNVTDEMIRKYNIGFCYQGKYINRIIIPSYDDDFRLNYFIARSYEYKPRLKYLNPEAQKETIIFNEHLIEWNKSIYIVEGAFDSIFLPNSIPMLGKSMSEKLFSLLYEKAKEVIVVLDGDAYDNAVKLYNKLNGGRLWGKVWVIKLPIDKDIADLCGDLTNYEKKQLE